MLQDLQVRTPTGIVLGKFDDLEKAIKFAKKYSRVEKKPVAVFQPRYLKNDQLEAMFINGKKVL